MLSRLIFNFPVLIRLRRARLLGHESYYKHIIFSYTLRVLKRHQKHVGMLPASHKLVVALRDLRKADTPRQVVYLSEATRGIYINSFLGWTEATLLLALPVLSFL